MKTTIDYKPGMHQVYSLVHHFEPHGQQYPFPMQHVLHPEFPSLQQYFVDKHQTVWIPNICNGNETHSNGIMKIEFDMYKELTK